MIALRMLKPLIRALILAGALAWPGAAPAAEAPPAQDLKDLRQQIQDLKQELASNEVNRQEAADALKQSETAISDANRALNQLSQQQRLSQAELARIQGDILGVRRSLDSNRTRIGKLLQSRYRNGRQEALRLLLNQQDPSRIARDLHYYRYIAEAQQKLAQQLEGQLIKLNQLANAIRLKNEELKLIASQKQQQKAQLAQDKQVKQQVVSQLAEKISSQRNQIVKLQSDEKRLTQLVERLNRLIREQEARARAAREKTEREARAKAEAAAQAAALAAAKARQSKPAGGKPVAAKPAAPPPIEAKPTPLPAEGSAFAAQKGRLRLPLAGAVKGKFGAARSEGSVWKGVFIQAASGQPVHAIAAGRVVFADWLRGFGNMLIVDHGGGYLSLYGAAESLLKQVGDPIKAGEAVATSGNSGGGAESGVYFEIRQQGRPQDPLVWVR